MKLNKKGVASVIIVMISFTMNAQQKQLTIDETITLAIENNAGLKASSLRVDETKALIGSSFSFDKTSLYYNYDENNLAFNDAPLKVFGIQQDFQFPTVYFADKKVNKAQNKVELSNYNMKLLTLKKEVSLAYYNLSYAKKKAETYQFLDSLYQDFAEAAKRRFELGETNYLEMITTQSKQKQLQTLYKQTLKAVDLNYEQLKGLVQVDSIAIQDNPLIKLSLKTMAIESNMGLQHFEDSKAFYKALHQQEKQQLLPDLSIEYFQGTNSNLNDNLKGYQLGIKIPLLFSGNVSKIRASKIAQDIVEQDQQDYKVKLYAEYNKLLAKLQQYNESINYYETQGNSLSKEIIKTAESSFKNGEIDFFQFIQSLENAKDIELMYLENLNNYNQTIITINYLIL